MKRYAARYLYTLTSPLPLENAFVEVDEEGAVLRTGLCEEGEEVLPGALCPGMVNAHCHVELSYMKGLFRKGTGMAGFIDQINELRDTSSLEDKIAALKEAMDQMYAQGVVAMAEGKRWYCDVGYGGPGPKGVMEIRAGEQVVGGLTYRGSFEKKEGAFFIERKDPARRYREGCPHTGG